MTIPLRKSTQSYQRHPLSAVWPDLEPQAWEALRQSMRQRGYDPIEPVVLYEGKVLDGWHRYLMAGELGIEFTTVDFDGDDPADLVIARHTGRRNLTPKDRAHGVVRCREWASTGRPAHDGEQPRDRGAGVPAKRLDGRLSSRPSTNKELAAQADVSERTIRRAKAQVRAKDKNHDASAAGGEERPLRPAGDASSETISQPQAAGRLEASRAGVQPAAATPGDEIQAPAVDTGHVAVSDPHRTRGKAADERRGGAARPAVRVEGNAMEAPEASARSDSVSDSSLHTESLVTLEREAGSATVGLGSSEPAAEQASSGSEPSRGVADAKIVMASTAAPASSDGGSGSPTEREVVESSTAEATDSEADPPVASEPGGTEAANPARGWMPPDSASLSDSGSGGTPTAVRGRAQGRQPAGPVGRVGGADVSVSPDSTPLLPAPAAVAGREAAAAHAPGVHAATAAQSACDADAERRHCLSALHSAAERLGAVSRVGTPSRFEAACRLVQALVAAIERCEEAGLDEQVLVAGLPADLVASLDAQWNTEIARGSTSTQDGGDVDGRGRGSAPLEQASNPRAWVQRFSLNRPGQQRAATAALCLLVGAADR